MFNLVRKVFFHPTAPKMSSHRLRFFPRFGSQLRMTVVILVFLLFVRGDRTYVGQFCFSPICGDVYFEKHVLLVSHETACIYAPPDFFLDF